MACLGKTRLIQSHKDHQAVIGIPFDYQMKMVKPLLRFKETNIRLFTWILVE
jgi:GMP synthase PP-ATPase subunit